MKKIITLFTIFILCIWTANAVVDSITPSTNDINKAKGWAHVNQVGVDVGEVTLEFVNPRNFYSCFEYRTDGDTSQIVAKNGGNNWNTNINDGLYPYFCLKNNTTTETIFAEDYVEVRMVFGAEGDERFDWTRFDVLFNRTADITSPSYLENVLGDVLIEANLIDDDVDNVQWAVREGSCAAGTNTIFGNVDGHSDSFIWTNTLEDGVYTHNFEFMFDAASISEGNYCFVFNPKEDLGESDIRLTREFNVVHTKADILINNGVPGKGIENAPGLQKVKPNENFANGTLK